MTNVNEFQIVPIDQVMESATNPRRHFDKAGMEELTESVRTHGVLVPLLVRSNGGRYEIVAGARRFRAARVAGLPELPVRVKDLDDTQTLEIQILENLQREDVHPLDEALGYRALMERAAYEVASIAAKVGKSESYVYQRLKLTELIEPVKKAFLDDRITAGHAILIARLQPKIQSEALEECFQVYGYNPNKIKECCSVRDLSRWIQNNVLLDLHAAPFKKDDPDLLPGAGACRSCPKRTGFSPMLFPDIAKKDICTDPACYEAKLKEHIVLKKWQLEAKGEKPLEITTDYHPRQISKEEKKLLPADKYTRIAVKKDLCEHARKAIIAGGHRDRGSVIDVCVDPKCKKHGWRMGSFRSDPRELARRKAEELKRKRETETRRRILDEVLGRVPGVLAREDLELVAASLAREMQNDDVKFLCSRHSWEPVKGQYNPKDYRETIAKQLPALPQPELLLLLIELSLVPEATLPSWGGGKPKRLLATAERYGVDAGAIEKQVAAEFAEKKKAQVKRAATKAKASRKKKPSGEPACEVCGCTEDHACPGGCAWSQKFRRKKRWVCTSCEDKVPLQTSAKEVA